MPALPTSTNARSYFRDLRALFSPRSDSELTRTALLKSILLRSVRIRISRHESAQLPLRIRPAMIVLNVIALVLLGVLGFHPRAQDFVPFNDKVLHFVCFLLATALFYFTFDVDESARRSWFWRRAALHLAFVTCFLFGGIGSEFVQSMLPYKSFSWGDVVANLLGSSVGLFLSYHAELRYRARREIERLYQPLDLEDYGDLDDELLEDDDHDDRTRRAEEARRAPNDDDRLAGTTKAGAGADRSRRVRFENVWDASTDDVDRVPIPSAVAAASTTDSKKRQEDLFSINDEDEEEEELAPVKGTERASAVGAETDVWREGSTK